MDTVTRIAKRLTALLVGAGLVFGTLCGTGCTKTIESASVTMNGGDVQVVTAASKAAGGS